MYSNSLLTDDTYRRADMIYKSVAEEYNPCLREYVASSKSYEKNFTETGRSYKNCCDAATKIGIAATSSPGCKDVGKCIMEMAETFKEVNMIREDLLQKFRDDIMYPIEKRLEQDSKYITGLRKKSQEEFKNRTNEAEKAFQNLAKIKKKSTSKIPSRKTDEKAQKATERILSAKASSEMMAHEMLNRAFSEERRRYCFFVEKQCDLIKALMNYHRQSFDILQANLNEWESVGSSYRELLPGAVALIEGSLPRYTSTSIDELEPRASVKENRLSSEDFNAMYQGPSVNSQVPLPNKSVVGVTGNESTRFVGSSKEIEMECPYQEIPGYMANGVQNAANDSSEVVVEQGETVISARSSASSMHMKALFRHSGTSTNSSLSQLSSFSSDVRESDPHSTGRIRTSLNDSGISIGEVWATGTDEYDTIKRAKTKSPKNETLLNIEVENTRDEKTNQNGLNEGFEVENGNENEPGPDMMEKVLYEALHEFIPEAGSIKLSFQKGDVILILSEEETGGWMYGENTTSQEKGWFPVNYTKRIEETSPGEGHDRSTPEPTSLHETTVPTSPQINLQNGEGDPRKSLNFLLKNPPVRESSRVQSPTIPEATTNPSEVKEQNKPKKTIVGRDVFQFARGMKNPFEEIQLRKTSTAALQ